MDWYLGVLKKYAVFTGRARRREYWMFVLFNFVIAFTLGFIEVIMSIPGLISTTYCLAILIPYIAVSVRRLHDTNRSGWWIFISFIPLIGTIILIIFMLQNSDSDENPYGENPKTIIT
jgi:uncharacterized membrane protein YhaH (DUF805 family)